MTNPVRHIAAVAAAAVLTVAANDQKPLDLVWFAGGGGSSEGLREAGFPPDYALNHNPVALWMHQVNHPDCTHLVDDAAAVHPATLEPGRRIRSFWASPDCTHFSIARGSAPKSPRIRGLAWCIADWAEQRRPEVIFIENVKEFTTWGPLDEHGQPIARRKGETFKAFIRRLEAAGYVVEWRVLNCADYGAPTTRKRLFIIARCDGEAIVWPARTHAPRKEAKALGLRPYVSAASCIDWSEDCPSIFMTQAEAKDQGLRVKRPLVPATERRIFKGIERYVAVPDPFIVQLTHQGERRPLDRREPFPTVTGANRGEVAAVVPTIVPILNATWSPDRVDDAADGLRTITAAKGGEFAVAAAFLGRQFGTNEGGADIVEPVGAIMGGGGGGKTQLIAASLMAYYGVGENVDDLREAARTATGKDRHGLTAAFLEQANTGVVGHDARDGLSTTTGRGTQQRAIEVRLQAIGALPGSRRRAVLEFLWKHAGQPTEVEWADPAGTALSRLKFGLVQVGDALFEIADIGMRMLKPRELFNAQGFRPDYIIDRDPWDRPITTTAATLMVGNSVPPPMARALAAANLGHAPSERMAA